MRPSGVIQLQRKWRDYKVKRLARIRIHRIENCCQSGVRAIISILRKPYGPWRYQYTTGMIRVNQTIDAHEQIVCPGINCDYLIVITIVDTTLSRFLGQVVYDMPWNWRHESELCETLPFQDEAFPSNVSYSGTEAKCLGEITFSISAVPQGKVSYSGSVAIPSTTNTWARKRSINTTDAARLMCLTPTLLLCYRRLEEQCQEIICSIALNEIQRVKTRGNMLCVLYREKELKFITRNTAESNLWMKMLS